jgi:hypothetical protein
MGRVGDSQPSFSVGPSSAWAFSSQKVMPISRYIVDVAGWPGDSSPARSVDRPRAQIHDHRPRRPEVSTRLAVIVTICHPRTERAPRWQAA